MSVLIVEDNAVSAKILDHTLTKAGHKTILAKNGKQALEYLEQEVDIQLVITDIMMPEMSGLELLKTLRESLVWRDVPVILCSAVADVENIKKAADLGCRHYLIKPFQADLLAKKVAEALKNERPIIKSESEVQRQFGLDKAGYAEISGTFYSLLQTQTKSLALRLADRSQTEFSVELADLAEGAAVLGAERLLDCLNSLLRRASNPDKEDTVAQYQVLFREMQLVLRALAKYAHDGP